MEYSVWIHCDFMSDLEKWAIGKTPSRDTCTEEKSGKP